VAEHVERLGADVVCLQEVEEEMLAAIAARLPGHEVHHAPKRGRRDGVATLTRLPVRQRQVVTFLDGTGHVALLAALEDGDRLLGVASAHVKWDPPGARLGVYQARELVTAVERFSPACDGWVLAGDFNAAPESELVEAMLARGWRDAYAHDPGASTCNANQVPRRIDFLFHTASLVAVPEPIPAIAPETPLPSDEQPSDHLAIAARFDWR
jgi:endonuclease/exonuclease/phosphatase family metal-dependent hydrolase